MFPSFAFHVFIAARTKPTHVNVRKLIFSAYSPSFEVVAKI
jgi:hypothetical protein